MESDIAGSWPETIRGAAIIQHCMNLASIAGGLTRVL